MTTTITGTATINGFLLFNPDIADEGSLTINALTIGGQITDTGLLTFNAPVLGTTVTFTPIDASATATITHPLEFFGAFNVQPNFNAVAPTATLVDLVGLAGADGYSLKNDLLSITGAGGKLLDVVRLAAGSIAPLVFEEGGSAYLTWGYGFDKIPGGPIGGPLPEHSSGT